jgi:hypothetical protein
MTKNDKAVVKQDHYMAHLLSFKQIPLSDAGVSESTVM